MRILLTMIYIYLFVFISWILFLSVMSLKTHRHELGPVAKIHGYALLGIGLAVDLVLTVVIGSVLFLSPPRELTLTGRLKRHKADGGWRGRMAAWVCEKLLNQFDAGGHHC